MTTRRDFVRAGALSMSALVLGIRPDGRVVKLTRRADRFAPNGWIAIDASGETVLTIGKQEMGQGVRTSLAMILADELDADWRTVRLVQATPGPNFQRLGTGGSWSIGGSWRTLREAGATARAMLVTAAATRLGVDAASLRTESGRVVHDASGRSLPYGELAGDAAALPVPSGASVKRAEQRRIVGTRVRRLDGPAIVTGAAHYGIDTRVPGMRYAVLERPPVIGGRMIRFDDSAARAVRGVQNVVATPSGVAVVATSTWAAIKGRRALRVEWDEGPNRTFSSAAHMQALERALSQDGTVTRREGTMPTSLPTNAVRARYHYPFEAHAPLEPMNCIAHVHDGRCELWVPTQAPNRAQAQVAQLLGIPEASVAVTPTLIGGGFGRRLGVDYALQAAELSRAINAPVQLLWTREDDMKHGHFQNSSVHEMTGALDARGHIALWRHKKAASLHNLSGPPTAEDLKDPVAYYQDSSWGVYDIPYDIGAIETSYVPVDVPLKIGPWRAVYSPSSTFARECFMDELAHAAKTDPIAFRLAHLGGAPAVKAGGLTIDRGRLRHVIELARDRAGWGSALPRGRGRGFACNVYDGDTHVAYVVEVSARRSPRAGQLPFIVHRVVCAIDCGVVINPLGIEQQIEGAVAWAISNMKGEITVRNGRVEQSTYLDFPVARMSETPAVETHIVPSHGDQPFGIGEPPVPPLVPAIVNAFFAATGIRVRSLPVRS